MQAIRTSPLVPKIPDFGINVHGFDLHHDNVSVQDKEKIIELVNKYRLVVFRNQGVLSGDKQVEISTWFGELESTFYKHPCSPHPDVFRVSNDPAHGCTGVGRTGWHVDGSFQPTPFAYSTYHIIECPQRGATVFMPLKEFLYSLPEEYRERLDRLSMLSDRRSMGTAKKLVYHHPVSGEVTMCFHLGMIAGFVYDQGTPEERYTTRKETIDLLDELERAIMARKDSLWYAHEWQPGDFIVSDNCAIAHEASVETQYPVDMVGLRVMHRTTTKGYTR